MQFIGTQIVLCYGVFKMVYLNLTKRDLSIMLYLLRPLLASQQKQLSNMIHCLLELYQQYGDSSVFLWDLEVRCRILSLADNFFRLQLTGDCPHVDYREQPGVAVSK